MRDFDYDVWQKKIIASGAKYKKGGAKSKKCTLLHENLTAKELKERNGKMATYNLNKPMTWEEFKAMPEDLKAEYLSKLRAKYNASGCALSEMLGVHGTTFNAFIRGTALEDPTKHRRMTEEQSTAWKRFLQGEDPKSTPVEEVAAEEPVVDETPAPVVDDTARIAAPMTEETLVSLSLNGSAKEIMQKLPLLLALTGVGEDRVINVQISIAG